MIDHTGVEWVTITEAHQRTGVPTSTIYVWIHRQRIRAHKIQGRAHIAWPDLTHAEKAMRARKTNKV